MAEQQLIVDVSEETDMMDLIDALSKAKGDLESLKRVIRLVGEKARKSDEDRETFGDFEGVATVLTAVKAQGGGFLKGEAMAELCLALPGICHKSTINRSLVRDDQGVDGIVDFLQLSVEEKNEQHCLAACVALKATCLANDGNKKVAARMREELNEEELAETDCQDTRVPLFKGERTGALDLILQALELFGPAQEHLELQSAALWALRTLCADDDNRQLSCVPSAVENRDKVSDEAHFSRLRKLVNAAMSVEPEPPRDLLEATLLLMKEVCGHQERIHCLVKEDGMLTKVRGFLTSYAKLVEAEGDTVVRACIFLLRQFAFSDDLKEMIGFETDLAQVVLMVVRQRTKNAAIVEQAFGLFSNLLLRKPHICEKMYAEPNRLAMVCQVVLAQHKDVVGVVKTVLSTLRNLSKVDGCVEEMRENEIFEQMRQLVRDKRGDDKWHDPVEISRRFLMEYREDEGVRNPNKWNEFY